MGPNLGALAASKVQLKKSTQDAKQQQEPKADTTTDQPKPEVKTATVQFSFSFPLFSFLDSFPSLSLQPVKKTVPQLPVSNELNNKLNKRNAAV
jgi:hypothetical protein